MFQVHLSCVLLFVENPHQSSAFYRRLFEKEPVEESPTFVLFDLQNGVQLGLWSKKTAEPQVLLPAGGSEIAFSEEAVDSIYEKWQKWGVPMAQEPTDMDFGRTFVAVDPDGHRIRIYRLFEEGKKQ